MPDDRDEHNHGCSRTRPGGRLLMSGLVDLMTRLGVKVGYPDQMTAFETPPEGLMPLMPQTPYLMYGDAVAPEYHEGMALFYRHKSTRWVDWPPEDRARYAECCAAAYRKPKENP